MRKTVAIIILLSICLIIPVLAVGCGMTSSYDADEPDNAETSESFIEPPTHSRDANETPRVPAAQPSSAAPVSPCGTPETKPNSVAIDTKIPDYANYIRGKVNGLNVRSAPTVSAISLGRIDEDDMLLYLGSENGWYKTYFCNEIAYVSASPAYTEIVEIERSDEKTERVIEIGAKLIGTPYIYGATRLHDGKGNFLKGFTIEKFDCSSFVQYAYYYGADILLEVTTRTQAVQGADVPLSELRRGDLIYFTNASRRDKTGIERIGHVAVYLGEEYVLHTASDYAVIERLTSARRANIVCVRRHL